MTIAPGRKVIKKTRSFVLDAFLMTRINPDGFNIFIEILNIIAMVYLLKQHCSESQVWCNIIQKRFSLSEK